MKELVQKSYFGFLNVEEQQKLWHDEMNRLDPRYGMHSSRRDDEHANSLSSTKDAYQPTGAPINRPERSWFQTSQILISKKIFFLCMRLPISKSFTVVNRL